MPELVFTVRWPDGSRQRCWSPSLVVRDHLAEGGAYPVEEFAARARTALEQGSERVRARFGSPCARALAQITEIDRRALPWGGVPVEGAVVTVESFEGTP